MAFAVSCRFRSGNDQNGFLGLRGFRLRAGLLFFFLCKDLESRRPVQLSGSESTSTSTIAVYIHSALSGPIVCAVVSTGSRLQIEQRARRLDSEFEFNTARPFISALTPLTTVNKSKSVHQADKVNWEYRYESYDQDSRVQGGFSNELEGDGICP